MAQKERFVTCVQCGVGVERPVTAQSANNLSQLDPIAVFHFFWGGRSIEAFNLDGMYIFCKCPEQVRPARGVVAGH